MLEFVAAIGAGGYFTLNKANDIAEQELTSFITQYTQEPLVINYLQSSPIINTATWQIKESTQDNIKSVLTLDIVGQDNPLNIPFNSQIIRGKTDYNGQSYGYGKIVSHPDLSEFKDTLPKQLTNDSIVSTWYVALDGSITQVGNMSAFQSDNGELDFKGLNSVVNTSLLDLSAYDGKVTLQPLTVSDKNGSGTLKMSAIDSQFTLDKEGKYQAKSQPFSFEFNAENQPPVVVNFSQGNYNGTYQQVEGLTIPVNSGEFSYDEISVQIDAVPVKFSAVKFSGGVHKAGEQLLDLTAGLSTNVDTSELKNSPMGANVPVHITLLKQAQLEYGFKKLPYVAVNAYYDTIARLSQNSDADIDRDALIKSVLSGVQKADSYFDATANVVTEEGNADLTATLKLSDQGKSITAEAFTELLNNNADKQQVLGLIEGKSVITINEKLADQVGVSAMLQMMLNVMPENGQYKLDAELKGGQATLNGQPL